VEGGTERTQEDGKEEVEEEIGVEGKE